MFTKTTSRKTHRLTRRLLPAVPVAAIPLLLVFAWPQLEREAQQRSARIDEGRRLAEAASFGQVQGVVTLDGQSLGTVEVAFLPDPALGTRGATASCYTDDQGRYTLHTQKEDHAGARVGHHRVVINDIAALPSPAGQSRSLKTNRVPPDYSNPFRTPLRFEVRSGSQTVNLELVTPEPEANP